MSFLHAKGLLWSVYVHGHMHTCWLKIGLQIYTPRTWKPKWKKKFVEKLKNLIVFDYYKKVSLSLSLSFSGCLCLCVHFCLSSFPLSPAPSLLVSSSLPFQPHLFVSLFSWARILVSLSSSSPYVLSLRYITSLLWFSLMLFTCVFMLFSFAFIPG